MKQSYQERKPLVRGFLRQLFEPASRVLYRIVEDTCGSIPLSCKEYKA